MVAVAALTVAGCGNATPPQSDHVARDAARSAPGAATPPRQHAPASASGPAAETAAVRRFARLGLPVFCGGTRRPMVALTFDDGPGAYTPLALKILRQAHVKATFFLVGRNLARFPGMAARTSRMGALGDHTWTHPMLPAMTPATVEREIGSTQAAISRDSGRHVGLFRPPYGARNGVVDTTARRLGMAQIVWNVDSGDSLGANWAGIARNVKHGLRPGSVVLMHENRGQTIRALKFVILPYLRKRDIELVTVPRLLAADPPTMAQLRAGRRGCGR
jgi:peptidoglycan/xylan/chitin deacetylase (PgdA/CDA1 family)